MTEEQHPEIDFPSLVIHIINTFGPFTEPAEDFVNGVVLGDGEYTIAVTPDGEGNVTITAEQVS